MCENKAFLEKQTQDTPTTHCIDTSKSDACFILPYNAFLNTLNMKLLLYLNKVMRISEQCESNERLTLGFCILSFCW